MIPPSRCWTTLRCPSGATVAGATTAPASGAVAAHPPSPPKKTSPRAAPARSNGRKAEARSRSIGAAVARIGALPQMSGDAGGTHQGGHDILARAEAGDTALLEHEDEVGVGDEARPVGDEDDRHPVDFQLGQPPDE